jgi:hypothetical protein
MKSNTLQCWVVRSTTGLCTRVDGCPLKTTSSLYCADTSNIRRRHSDTLLLDHIHNLIASEPRTGWTYASYTEQPHLKELYRPEKMQNGVLQPVLSHRPWVDRHILQSLINGVVAGGKTAGVQGHGARIYQGLIIIFLDLSLSFILISYLFPGHFRYKAIFVTDGYSSSSLVPSLKYILYIKKKLRGLSPQANYTDRATAACRRTDKNQSVFRFTWMTQFCSKLLLRTKWIPTKPRCETRSGVWIKTKNVQHKKTMGPSNCTGASHNGIHRNSKCPDNIRYWTQNTNFSQKCNLQT